MQERRDSLQDDERMIGGKKMGRIGVAFLIIGVGAVGLFNCTTSGERAESGECPEGEVCSDLTPDGLYFKGTELANGSINDSSLKVTAVGGVQTVTVLASADETDIFELDFEATLEGGDVVLDGVTPPTVTLFGEQAGTGMLRIVDPPTAELFDRVTVEAAPIAEYLLKPIHEETPFDGAWALFNGGVQHVYVALHDSGDQILVDESTTMGAATALSQGTVSQVAWDTLELDGVAPGDLELWVETGDGGRHEETVSLVDDVDEIVVDENIIELTDPVTVGSLATGCFRASRDGATVVGADWEYSFVGAGTSAVQVGFWPNCFMFDAENVGTVTVTASAGSASAEVTVQVVAALPPAPHSGERLQTKMDMGRARNFAHNIMRPVAGQRASGTGE